MFPPRHGHPNRTLVRSAERFESRTAHVGIEIDSEQKSFALEALGQLVSLSSTHCCAYTCDLSPGSLPGALPFMVGDLILECTWRLDAFSAYYFPTWLPSVCAWRHNWYTRGRFAPVLSY